MLAYAARVRCFLGLLAMETRSFDGSVVMTRHCIVEIVFSACTARPLGNEWALLFALGFRLEITARIVGSTCFLASSLILSGTIEGGAHRTWKRFTMLNELSVVLDCCRIAKSDIIPVSYTGLPASHPDAMFTSR